jgi:hypothetical protein
VTVGNPTEFHPIKDEPDLKCQMCGYFNANIYLFENNTAYPNCGDQTCVSAWYWDHPIALRAMERLIYNETPPELRGPERP